MPSIQELVENYTPPVAGPTQKDPEALMKELMNTPLFMDHLPADDEVEDNDTLAAIQSLVYGGNPDGRRLLPCKHAFRPILRPPIT